MKRAPQPPLITKVNSIEHPDFTAREAPSDPGDPANAEVLHQEGRLLFPAAMEIGFFARTGDDGVVTLEGLRITMHAPGMQGGLYRDFGVELARHLAATLTQVCDHIEAQAAASASDLISRAAKGGAA